MMVAVSFAAGLNLYATTATLGLLARFGVLTLPGPIAALSNEWVIGASLALFLIEFVADKIPMVDLMWSALQTFVKVPAGALLAWSATTSLSPAAQMVATIGGGAIALAAHGAKVAIRGSVTASPEPLSNIVLSAAEDVGAIALTWFATRHPYLAAALAIILVIAAVLVIRLLWVALRAFGRRAWQRNPG